MKLRSVVILMAGLYAGTGAYGQTITLSLHHAPLQAVFDSIEKKSKYRFWYTGSMLKHTVPVDLNVHNASIEEVLLGCFKDQPLTYIMVDSTINLRLKETGKAPASPAMVSGNILNERNDPVVGVTVVWKGTAVGTVTDDNGAFSLPDIKDSTVLVLSSVNIEMMVLPVERRPGWKVVVHTRVSELDVVEVNPVSTGYQEISIKKTTGSFYKIDNELLNRRVSPNILDRLVDVTSGLNYEPKQVNVAGRSPVMIRGVSTINANMGPLIVVDNFPYSGDINNINPGDIESVTILKDAAAASIWGVQAGNGVIVVVTKKGSFSQRIHAHVSSAVTTGGRPDLGYFPVIGSADYADMEQRLFGKGFYDGRINDSNNYPTVSQGVEILVKQRNGQLGAAEAGLQLARLRQYDVRGDVDHYFLQNSVRQQYAANASGGSAKFSYYCSLGYDHNLGNNVGDSYKRLTVRSDNTFKPLPGLELNGYIIYTKTETGIGMDYTSLLPTGVVEQLAPYTRLADEDGKALAIPKTYRLAYTDSIRQPGLADWHYRPLDELKYKDQASRQADTRLGAGVKYSFAGGMMAELKYQYEKGLVNSRDYSSPLTFYTRNLVNQYMYSNATGPVYPVPLGGIADFVHSEMDAWNLRAQLSIKRDLAKYPLIAFAGTEIREVNMDVNASRKYGYDPAVNTFSKSIDYNTKFLLRPSGFAPVPDNDLLSGSINRYVSYFARTEYTINAKYILSASGRIDESNFFGVKANQRRVPLWSAGGAWTLSGESFYHIAWLPYLKLRATYGYNGNTNNNATAYATIQYMSASASSLIPAQYSRIVSPPNPELRWEKIRIINFGADFESKDKCITGSIEYYLKTGLDLISQVSVDPTTGFTSYTGNNASIKGSGIDIVLNSSAGGNTCRWTNNFLLSYTTDKVVSYQQISSAFDYISGAKAPFVGRPLFSLYSYKWAGLDPVNGDPRAWLGNKVADYSTVVSKAGPADLVYNGPMLPRVFGAVRNTFYWKNLALSLNITYKLGYYFRRGSINYRNLLYNWGGHSDYLLRWQQPGDEARTQVPSLAEVTGTSRDQAYLYSDILVEKADHIRLRDIRLSYDLTKKAMSRLPAEHIQLYVYVNNIGILWKANHYGIDPDYGSYLIPAARTVSAGITMDF